MPFDSWVKKVLCPKTDWSGPFYTMGFESKHHVALRSPATPKRCPKTRSPVFFGGRGGLCWMLLKGNPKENHAKRPPPFQGPIFIWGGPENPKENPPPFFGGQTPAPDQKTPSPRALSRSSRTASAERSQPRPKRSWPRRIIWTPPPPPAVLGNVGNVFLCRRSCLPIFWVGSGGFVIWFGKVTCLREFWFRLLGCGLETNGATRCNCWIRIHVHG